PGACPSSIQIHTVAETGKPASLWSGREDVTPNPTIGPLLTPSNTTLIASAPTCLRAPDLERVEERQEVEDVDSPVVAEPVGGRIARVEQALELQEVEQVERAAGVQVGRAAQQPA